jgi:hypothetical protein
MSAALLAPAGHFIEPPSANFPASEKSEVWPL